jgi:hypothetical protein
VTNVPHVLAGQAVGADWWVRPLCEGRTPIASVDGARTTLLLQFATIPPRPILVDLLRTASLRVGLVHYCATAQLAVIETPDPVPATVVNELARLPQLRWLEPDCGCFSRHGFDP